MEVSCITFFLRCAYASADLDLLAEGLATGLLADSEMQGERELLKQGIFSGALRVRKEGINTKYKDQEERGQV
jgi:hypothetical protein